VPLRHCGNPARTGGLSKSHLEQPILTLCPLFRWGKLEWLAPPCTAGIFPARTSAEDFRPCLQTPPHSPGSPSLGPRRLRGRALRSAPGSAPLTEPHTTLTTALTALSLSSPFFYEHPRRGAEGWQTARCARTRLRRVRKARQYLLLIGLWEVGTENRNPHGPAQSPWCQASNRLTLKIPARRHASFSDLLP
jgi:hypothetical protein